MSPLIRKLREGSDLSPSRIWYNNWLERNVSGRVLDIGKSRYWDYGLETIDIDFRRRPDIVGDICKSYLPSDTYDMVLCNGMYEVVSDPQKMVDEVRRILKPWGKVIFGFVGVNYVPYSDNWRCYNGDIKFGMEIVESKDFPGYHFIICQRNSAN